MKKKLRSKGPLFFLILLGFIPFLWFSGNQLILGYDVVFPLRIPDFLIDRIFSWTSRSGFEMDQSGIAGSFIIHAIDSLPLFLGFGPQMAQKLVFSFWFLAMIISAYVFIVRLERFSYVTNKYTRYYFPVLYTFNFYILQAWWAVERTKFSLVVALPLVLAIVFPFVEGNLSKGKIIRASILTSLLLFFFNGGGWVGMPLYGGLVVVLICFFFFCTFLFIARKKYKDVLYILVYLLLLPLLYLLFNAYSVFPFLLVTLRDYQAIVSSAGGVEGAINWTRYISEHASFINLFRFQGIPDWYNSHHQYANYYFNNPLLIASSYVFPLMLLLSFNSRNDKKIRFFFLFLVLVSIFFTAGIHPPFGLIFEVLMMVIPGFAAFRSAIFKFGYAYWFAGSFLIALFLGEIVQAVTRKIEIHKRYIAELFLSFLIVVGVVTYHFPYLTGNFFKIETTTVSSRVNMPSYVLDFSNWWHENGRKSRVLLLPKLNDTWFFEQYKWNYMSTSPILENFANQNTIENAAVLSGDESFTLNALYNSINQKDVRRTNALLDALSIEYLLVRNDFYWDYPDQETDNPKTVAQSLTENPSITKVKNFGAWELYRYKENPIIFTKTNGVATYGSQTEEYLVEKQPLVFNQYIDNHPISDILIQPKCLNCELENKEFSLQIPKPRILLNSKLYLLVSLRDAFFSHTNGSPEEVVGSLLGNSIQMSGQMNELINQDDQRYITVAKDNLLKDFSRISSTMNDLLKGSQNSYGTLFVIQQYLVSENRYFSKLASEQVNNEKTFSTLQEVIFAINNLNEKVKALYPIEDIATNKRFNYNSPFTGQFLFRIKKDSLGTLSTDLSEIPVSIDNQNVGSLSAKLEGEYLNLGYINLSKGDHTLALALPTQKNLLVSLGLQEKAGEQCKVFKYEEFSPLRTYSLRFQSRNNFDPSFYLLVDNGEEDPIEHPFFFPIVGDEVYNKIQVSTSKIALRKNSHTLRVSFCAETLTDDLFKDNISDLEFIELSAPVVLFSRKENVVSSSPPKITFEQISQVHYKAHIVDAKMPYYLVLNKRFSSGWKASVGERVEGSQISNAWYVTKKGDAEIDIWYSPQDYFMIGLVVTTLSLIGGIFVYRKIGKYE